jgi:hypothetical protein
MSNPNSFMHIYAAKTEQLVALIQDLRGMNDWLVQDPTLLDRYFAQSGSGPGAQGTPRSDIVKADVVGAQEGLDEVIFAYDSGAPTQKSKILKLIP